MFLLGSEAGTTINWMYFFRLKVALWPSHYGMLQQYLIHTLTMQFLFVNSPLNFWGHLFPTWLLRRWKLFFLSSLLLSLTDIKTFQVTQFVNGLFESRTDLSVFKNHIRDFLVQSKEFSAQVTDHDSFCLFLLYSIIANATDIYCARIKITKKFLMSV